MAPIQLRVRWGYVLKIIALVLLALAVILLIWLALGARDYAYRFTHVGCIGPLEGLGPEGYESELVTFPSPKGYDLHGWLSHGTLHPEIAIVALPGASGNGYFALPDARILAAAGYSTLVMEHRSCANPALIHSGGYYESFDLEGAVDYLKSRPGIKHVGVLGFSTGGTATLLAASRDPNIEAVVAIGGFMSMEDDMFDPEVPHTPVDLLGRWMLRVFTEQDMGVPITEVSPINHIRQISPRPVFLIYGDVGEEHDGRALYAAAGDPKELWIVPGAGHAGEQTAYPDEYRRRVLAFFSRAFGLGGSP